jgi:hypothetical protein
VNIFKDLVDTKDAPGLYIKADEKVLQHLMLCRDCRPGIRCIEYMSLMAVCDTLIWKGIKRDQAN